MREHTFRGTIGLAIPHASRLGAARIAPFAMVLATAVGIWLATGVGGRDVILFLCYQVGFVVAPGFLVFRALLPEESFTRSIVFGWAVGYALEIGMYALAAASSVRGLYVCYPLLAAPLIPLVVRRWRASDETTDPTASRALWTAAAVGVVTLGYLGLSYFARTPLPWDVAKVTYDTDVPFSLSLAAEALHHWPMTDPNVSGSPFHYYVAAHLDLAATSDVTGIPLPVSLFRLAVVPMSLLVIAQFVIAGRAFVGRLSAGALAAGLFLLVGEVDPEPWFSFPFLGLVFEDVWLSPTFLVGLVFFLGAVTLIGERITSAAAVRAGTRHWLVVAVFLVACAAAKPSALAVLLGGLALMLVWWSVSRRRLNANAAFATGLTASIALVFYLGAYSNSNFGLGLHPFRAFEAMSWANDVRDRLGDTAGWPLAVVAGALGLFGPQLAGLMLVRRRNLDEGRSFLLAMLAVGLAGFVLFHQSGNSQVYFSHYGLVGGTLLAAEGLLALGAAFPARRSVLAAAVMSLATATAIAFVVYGVVVHFSPPGPSLPALHARGALAMGLLMAMFLAVWLWGLPERRSLLFAACFVGSTAIVLASWRAGWMTYRPNDGLVVIAALVAITGIAVLLTRGRRRREFMLALLVVVITVGAVDVPLDHAPNAIDRARAGLPVSNAGATGMSRELNDGLAWIRDHTSPDAVLAVNNFKEAYGRSRKATYFYYAAFAERRVFLEGWLYSAQSWNVLGENAVNERRSPFPRRLRLNRAVFERADPRALRVLVREYGVRYLVDDKLQGRATPEVRALGRLVYDNEAVAVYAVGPDDGHA